MAKCLECVHWKPCFSGTDWDAVVAIPCEYFSTIEAEPVRHGRWVKAKHTKYYSGFDSEGDLVSWRDYPVLCSSCHYDLTENGARETNYCPNCGAKMDEEV